MLMMRMCAVYHARVRLLLQLVKNAVSTGRVAQVLLLGAGLDTFVEQTVHVLDSSVSLSSCVRFAIASQTNTLLLSGAAALGGRVRCRLSGGAG